MRLAPFSKGRPIGWKGPLAGSEAKFMCELEEAGSVLLTGSMTAAAENTAA